MNSLITLASILVVFIAMVLLIALFKKNIFELAIATISTNGPDSGDTVYFTDPLVFIHA